MKSKARIAIYPGSFDPITMGHVDIIERVAKVFDHVIILVATSDEKESLFPADVRKALIEKSLKHLSNIEVDIHEGLTVDYARKKKASVLIRGLRAVVDFEYEVSMANMNFTLDPEIETLLVFARPEFYFLSSRSVKAVAKHKGKLKGLVPTHVETALRERFSQVGLKKAKSK